MKKPSKLVKLWDTFMLVIGVVCAFIAMLSVIYLAGLLLSLLYRFIIGG